MDRDVLIGAVAFAGMLYLIAKMGVSIFVCYQAWIYDEVVSQEDPIVHAQVSAYRAEQERARRRQVDEAAERATLGGVNLESEKRGAAERMGQLVGQFAAETIAKEVEARRRFKLGLFAAATSLVSKP